MEIRGADEFSDLIGRMKSNVGLNHVSNVVKTNATEFQQKAMRSAPVDTGFLRRSITLEMTDGGLTARVYAYADYAVYLEFGTRYQPAQPYFRPNFYPQTFQFKRDMANLLK